MHFWLYGTDWTTPASQPNQPTPAEPVNAANNEEMTPDITTQKPPPRAMPYHQPSFNLDRPTRAPDKG